MSLTLEHPRRDDHLWLTREGVRVMALLSGVQQVVLCSTTERRHAARRNVLQAAERGLLNPDELTEALAFVELIE